MSQQPLAYLYPEFLESAEARPDPHSRRVSRAAAPLQGTEDSGHGRVLRVGARRQPRARRARAAARLRARGVHDADEHYEAELTKIAQGGRVGALLRGRARAGAAAHDVEPHAAVRASSLRRHLGRRSRHHGGRQPRRARSGRQDDRSEHPPAVRAGRQPVHHRRPALRVPLLLHAEVLVRVPGQGAGRSSRAASARSTSCSRF